MYQHGLGVAFFRKRAAEASHGGHMIMTRFETLA